MKLSNIKIGISFDNDFETKQPIPKFYDENDEWILGINEWVFNTINQQLAKNNVTLQSEIVAWKSVGCLGNYMFCQEKIRMTCANWYLDDYSPWEIIIELANYPNFYQKFTQQPHYLDRLLTLKNFAELVFNAIQTTLQPKELSVFLFNQKTAEFTEFDKFII